MRTGQNDDVNVSLLLSRRDSHCDDECSAAGTSSSTELALQVPPPDGSSLVQALVQDDGLLEDPQ